MQELIIIENKQEKNIYYVEDGILKEFYKERQDKKRLEGNIYAGKVEKVLPGMQAAFVDIGEGKNTFLHIRDILPKKSKKTGNKEENLEEYKIKDYIKPNQMLLLQVKKDSTEIKGARVSTNIQIEGRFAIILPENDFITVSQKIEDNEERNRLINIAKKIKKDQKIGIILRTASEKKEESIIQNDIEKAISKLKNIENKFNEVKKQSKPSIIQKNDTILEKILLDISDNGLDKIWVNTEILKKNVEDILNKLHGKKTNIKVEYQEQKLENRYEIKKQEEKISNRKIWLKCGGFITIDKTEALTAIDVNSRKIYRKGKPRKNGNKSK